MDAIDWSVWGPPLLVLALGLVAGLGFAARARQSAPVDTRRQDLEVRRQVLLNTLHELDADKNKLDPAEYQSRRDQLIAEAAEVLRGLEQPDAAPTSAPASAPRTGSLLAYSVGGAVFLALAGLVLQQSVKPRVEMTAAAATVEGQLSAAKALAEANPQDIKALNEVTRLALVTRDLDLAMQTLDKARAINPEDPGVLTHFGALLVFIGRDEQAEESLQKALAVSPGYGEARLWLAVARANRGDLDGAEEVARALAADPSASANDRMAASSLFASLEEAERRMAAEAAIASGLGADGASGAAPAEAGPPVFSGKVSGAEGLAPGGVLYVYVRSSEVPAGRPLAAVRIPDWSLPLDFALSDKDLIGGGQWPEQVWLQAKVSRSGDPMQKSPDDVASAVIGPVKAGATGLELVLGGS